MPDQEDGRGAVVVKTPSEFDLFGAEFVPDPVALNTDGIRSTAEVDTDESVVDQRVYSRSIDLGDGSGKQVFKATSQAELIDVLVKAQENATRKIQELNTTVKAARVQPQTASAAEVKKALTADELFAIANELQKDPVAAIDKVFKAKTGKSMDDYAAQLTQFETERGVAQAETTFLLNHKEDWVPSNANAAAMNKFITDNKLPYTAQNLEYAYQELTEAGGLPDAVEIISSDKVAVATHTRSKPMSTGLKNTSTARKELVAEDASVISESDVEQIYKLPEDEARVLMNKLMARAKSRSSQQ